MSSCEMLVYGNVTDTAWQYGMGIAARYGVKIDTDAGQATSKGFTISWNRNKDERNISIHCIDKPFLIPCSVINRKINSLVEECLKQQVEQSL